MGCDVARYCDGYCDTCQYQAFCWVGSEDKGE